MILVLSAIVFKDFSDNLIVLDDTPALVITGEDNGGIPLKKNYYYIKRKRYFTIP